jgi:arabinose-5-phosphate isomerase
MDAGVDLHQTEITRVMTHGGRTIEPTALAIEAAQMMQEYQVQGLLVVGKSGELVGALNFQDLLKAGVV